MSRIVKPSVEFIKGDNEFDMIKTIERIARTCYKSEDLITEISGTTMIKALLAKEHYAMFDHQHITYKYILAISFIFLTIFIFKSTTIYC